ncbi:AAA family ATPase [bacterium]|nr:AAA family ATPase [bacterium]
MSEVEVLGQKESSTTPKDGGETPDFSMTPEELESYLLKYVVRQEDAVEILATKIATHFNRMRWEREAGAKLERIPGQIKPNILMIGPTGVGKTYLVRLIAEKVGVPFVKGDATKFSETGYVGGDVEDMIRDLVKAADGDIEKAEYGIVYIDEIDKIAASGSLVGPDVSRTGVQRNLLKLMEETEVELRVPHDLASQMEAVMETQRSGKAPQKKINTRNILFIVSGAFQGLDKIVSRRLNKQPLGFESSDRQFGLNDRDLMEEIRTEDLLQYGFESEFIGRLPVLAKLNELDEDGLFEILSNPHNAVIQGKIRDFKAYGIDLEITEEAMRTLAAQAYKEKTGARGLTRVVEKALITFEKRLPSSDVTRLRFTKDMLDDAQTACKELIVRFSLDDAVERFRELNGITLHVSPAAKRWLQENAPSGEKIGDFMLSRLEGNEHGFRLINKDDLQVTVNFLQNPREYIEKLIKRSYQNRDQSKDESAEE